MSHRITKRWIRIGIALAGLGLGSGWVGATAPIADAGEGEADPATLQWMQDLNDVLRPQWLDLRVEQIQFLTVGQGRPRVRMHQQEFRWVPGDPRRHADGDTLSYLVDPSWGAVTTSGVSQPATEASIDRAMAVWAADTCMSQRVVKRAYPGGDVTLFDAFLDRGGLGEPFAADVIQAGWLSGDGVVLSPNVLGISVTFIFVDPDTGEPTDLDGDQRLDTALNEIYYNDDFEWVEAQDGSAPAGTFDVETVALHEAGHAIGLGHFGSPPEAVMNPVYQGVKRLLKPVDHAGVCSVWASW